jgi:hypothetical protein
MKRLAVQNSHLLNYAIMLIVGLLIGSSVTYVLTTNNLQPDQQQAKGLMTSHQGSSTYFNGNDWQIQSTYSILDKEVNMFLSIRSENEILVSLQLDPQVYKLINAQCQGCSATPAANFYSGEVSFSAAGETVYKIQMNYQPGILSPIEIEVNQDGAVEFLGAIVIR